MPSEWRKLAKPEKDEERTKRMHRRRADYFEDNCPADLGLEEDSGPQIYTENMKRP